MTIEEVQIALTKGLLAGYGGKSKFGSTNRGGIDMKSSHYEDETLIYHDEWFPGSNGGGQELIISGDVKYTRLYAGGVVAQGKLSALGITEKMVISELIRRIQELGSLTRLFAECLPSNNGDWGYTYSINESNAAVGVTVAKETITYKGEVVFIHLFLLSPLA